MMSSSVIPQRANSALAALLLLVLVPAGYARSAVTTEGILRLTTNYDYRGYTRSDDEPTVQANVDTALSSGLFLGAWVSAIDMDSADIEFNPYLGVRFRLSPDWQLTASLAGYFYDERVLGQNADYGEAMLQLAYRDIGLARLHVAPDYFGTGHTVVNYELELRYPLMDTIEVSGGLGYQLSRDALKYDIIYAHVGISWFIQPRLTLDLRYHESHETNEQTDYQGYEKSLFENRLDRPLVFSISVGF